MVDEEFIIAFGRVSYGKRFEDMKQEWNYYTFRIEDNNCQICRQNTDISIIYHHATFRGKNLLLCQTCSNRINPLYLTQQIQSIYAVLGGRRESLCGRLIENALSIGVIDRSTHDTYLGFIGRKNLSPEREDYRRGINGRLIRNYFPNAFPPSDEDEE